MSSSSRVAVGSIMPTIPPHLPTVEDEEPKKNSGDEDTESDVPPEAKGRKASSRKKKPAAKPKAKPKKKPAAKKKAPAKKKAAAKSKQPAGPTPAVAPAPIPAVAVSSSSSAAAAAAAGGKPEKGKRKKAPATPKVPKEDPNGAPPGRKTDLVVDVIEGAEHQLATTGFVCSEIVKKYKDSNPEWFAARKADGRLIYEAQLRAALSDCKRTWHVRVADDNHYNMTPGRMWGLTKNKAAQLALKGFSEINTVIKNKRQRRLINAAEKAGEPRVVTASAITRLSGGLPPASATQGDAAEDDDEKKRAKKKQKKAAGPIAAVATQANVVAIAKTTEEVEKEKAAAASRRRSTRAAPAASSSSSAAAAAEEEKKEEGGGNDSKKRGQAQQLQKKGGNKKGKKGPDSEQDVAGLLLSLGDEEKEKLLKKEEEEKKK